MNKVIIEIEDVEDTVRVHAKFLPECPKHKAEMSPAHTAGSLALGFLASVLGGDGAGDDEDGSCDDDE